MISPPAFLSAAILASSCAVVPDGETGVGETGETGDGSSMMISKSMSGTLQNKCPSSRQRRVTPREYLELQMWQRQIQGHGFIGGTLILLSGGSGGDGRSVRK